MSTDLEIRQTDADYYERYRALSTAAVASLIVGLLSCLALLDWLLVALPVIGIPLAIYALAQVKRRSDELTGMGVARAGLTLSLLFAVLGPARLTYDYLTEVPEGYERISYSDLQPDSAQAGQVVPPSALDLEGKNIFIKGFIYPGREKDGIRQFLLVRDQGDCCFGGNPKITDRILVQLKDTKGFNFSGKLFKVAGEFHIAPPAPAADAQGVVLYHLANAELR